jgi:hypothetical protein
VRVASHRLRRRPFGAGRLQNQAREEATVPLRAEQSIQGSAKMDRMPLLRRPLLDLLQTRQAMPSLRNLKASQPERPRSECGLG